MGRLVPRRFLLEIEIFCGTVSGKYFRREHRIFYRHCACRSKRMMMSLDSGMLVVITIIAMYMTIVFILLFHVKNEWCDILNSNLTVRILEKFETFWMFDISGESVL